MFRFVAPAGTPIHVRDIYRALRSTATRNGETGNRDQAICDWVGVKRIFPTNSGRAGICLALRALHQLRPERNVVAIPAYTCYTVAAAVVRAGLKIRLLEMAPGSLSIDYNGLALGNSEKLLCVLSSNLCGYPDEMSRLHKAARDVGAYVLDDAAQALGAQGDLGRAGAKSDVGIFSFGRGKPLATIEGGMIVCNDPIISEAISLQWNSLPASSVSGARLTAQLLIYSALLRPELYWIPNSLPFLNLGATEFNPEFTIEQMPSLSLEMLLTLVPKFSSICEARSNNAKCLRDGLEGNVNFRVALSAAGTEPNYLRLPIISRTPALREQAVALLIENGIGASKFYPTAICEIPGIEAHLESGHRHCKVAATLAETILTVPTHPYVSRQDTNSIIGVLNEMKSNV